MDNATIDGANATTNIAINNQKPKSETYSPVYLVGFWVLTYFGLRYAFKETEEN